MQNMYQFFLLAALYLLSETSMEGMEAFHMIQEPPYHRSEYQDFDLAGRVVIDLKNQTILSPEDRLNFVVPINFGKNVDVIKIYSDCIFNRTQQMRSVFTLDNLIQMIENDVSLRDYEQVCDPLMSNRNTRKQIAAFIRSNKSLIKKICNKDGEQAFVYNMLQFDFCSNIGKIPIEEIKRKIKEKIESLKPNSKESLKKEIRGLKEQIHEKLLDDGYFERNCASLKKQKYAIYMFLMITGGFTIYLYFVDFRKLAAAYGLIFISELWMLHIIEKDIIDKRREIAMNQENIQKLKQKLQDIET